MPLSRSPYFDPNALSLPEAGYYGNLGRKGLIGPGMVSVDGAVHRTFRLNEHQSLRFRAEGFNLANHPNFQLPTAAYNLFSSTGLRIGSTGRITETTTTSRQLQMALRWNF